MDFAVVYSLTCQSWLHSTRQAEETANRAICVSRVLHESLESLSRSLPPLGLRG
jgi:hypothetical protein